MQSNQLGKVDIGHTYTYIHTYVYVCMHVCMHIYIDGIIVAEERESGLLFRLLFGFT
jgi:hypothetical protein